MDSDWQWLLLAGGYYLHVGWLGGCHIVAALTCDWGDLGGCHMVGFLWQLRWLTRTTIVSQLYQDVRNVRCHACDNWHTHTRTTDGQWKVEQYSIWAESAIVHVWRQNKVLWLSWTKEIQPRPQHSNPCLQIIHIVMGGSSSWVRCIFGNISILSASERET